MKIIFTHTHLCNSSFDGDLKDVLNRAAGSGLYGVVEIGEELFDAKKNM